MADSEMRHRLVVLGAGKVGKTSIVQRFLKGTFSESYKATVEDLHCRDYDINGSVIRVDFLDTAGDLVFPAMRRLSISTAHAFIIVYAIDNALSFEEVKQVREQVKEQRANFHDLPFVVVGNKLDKELSRAVDMEEVMDWLRGEGLESSYVEVSAKEDRFILDIFQKLLSQANIPQVRKLEPILKRRLSANATRLSTHRQHLREQEEGKLSRSRSLIRRTSKPKVKQTGDPTRNDCVIS